MDKQAETQRAQSTEVIVEARNLSKTYRDFWGRSKKVALKPLDLEIRQGEIFGLTRTKWFGEDNNDETAARSDFSNIWRSCNFW